MGRSWGGRHFDLTWQVGYGPAHTVAGSTPPSQPGRFAGQNADGTYRFRSHGLLLSCGWDF